MNILSKHIPIVKDQLEFHQKQAEKYKSSPFRSKLHNATAAQLADLYKAIYYT